MRQEGTLQPTPLGTRLSLGARRWTRGTLRFAQRQPLGAISLLVLVLVVILAALAPWIVPYSSTLTSPADSFLSPGAKHFFGTDQLGRDLFSRILSGTRVSLQVSFFSIVLGTTGGYLLGIVSGYIGGRLDDWLQRVIDAMLAFPPILLALAIVAALGPGLDKVIFAISFTFAPRAARVSRGVVLSVKENVYVDAARVVGSSTTRIVLRHILPNSMAPYLILASVSLGTAILTEAALSYLGLGVPDPYPSWGRMMSGAAQQLALLAPWMVLFPGMAITVMVLAFNLLGDSLRDIWDPRLRGR